MRVALFGVLMLAGCSNAAEQAEKQYEIVVRSGTPSEKCEAAKKVQAAYLSAGDEKNYREWQMQAQGECTLAKFTP